MNSGISNIDLLKLYIDSGIDETYNQKPFIYLTKPADPFKQKAITENNNLQSMKDVETKATEAVKNITTIDNLKLAIKNFVSHPLLKFASNVIVGCGVNNPKVLVITEHPNENEDRSGKILTGPSGDLLVKILSAINLDIDNNVFVVPFSPYRPPGGRNLSKEEVNILMPFIKKYIEILKPKFILTFGSPVNHLLNNDDTITSLSGKFFDFMNTKLFSTFSTSYLLNNKEAKKKAWNDLQILMKEL